MVETVAVLGAGAVGSYFIAGLFGKLGDRLWVIANGDRKRRLKEQGLLINGRRIFPCVKEPEEARGVDLLLVALKYGALPGSLEPIAEIADSHTIVMSVMNGVDSEEIIAARIGREHMVFSLMQLDSERQGGNIQFHAAPDQGVYFGEADGQKTGRIEEIAAVFEGSGVYGHVCSDIIREMWLKYAYNICYNLPQAMIGCGIGVYCDSTYASHISKKLRNEVEAVAAAKGIDIARERSHRDNISAIPPQTRFSTLQDLEAGRHTEIDMFSGTLMRMGRELGISTPYNEMAYHLIKALEEKNDGKFGYSG